MSFFEPVGVESDPGTSPHPASMGHEHQLFDVGIPLTLESNYTGYLTAYLSADWILLDGVIQSSGPTTTETVAKLPFDRRPEYGHVYICPFETISFPGVQLSILVQIISNGDIIIGIAIGEEIVSGFINSLLFRRN